MTDPTDRGSQALAFGIAVPILYFGLQLIAAPFYPGYSFLTRDASTLGSNGSRAPWIFNVGALILGLVTLVAAWGFLRALRRRGVKLLVAWLAALAIASCALGSINAFLFPLPDPRHSQSVLAVSASGGFALPPLLALALWKLPNARLLKTYLVINILVWLTLIPIMSGLIQRVAVMTSLELPRYQSFLNGYHGLLQRIVAAVVFGPIGVGACRLYASAPFPHGRVRTRPDGRCEGEGPRVSSS